MSVYLGTVRRRRRALLSDMVANAVFEHFEGDEVVPALGNDDICKLFARLDVHFVHRLYRGQVLLHDRFERALPFVDVAADAAQDADVRVGVDKDADVH